MTKVNCDTIFHIKKDPFMNIDKKGIFRSSFSFEVRADALTDASLPTVFTLDSLWTGEKAPEIHFQLSDIFDSLTYDFGGKDEYRRNEWRVPPFVDPEAVLTVSVTVPEGTTLTIRSFGCASCFVRPVWEGGVRLNAHLGFWGFAPENTMAAVTYAAACGYPACIVVPKVTKDGVFVCIHDDSVNRTGHDADGKTAGDEHLFIRDMTFAELRTWEFGSFKHKVWKDEKILLLSDFFKLCARTGMRPMFSTHPALTREQWLEVRKMLIDCDLLSKLNIKSFDPEVLRLANEVLGTEIEGYTLDVGPWNNARDTCVEIMDGIGFDKAKSRVGIELYPAAMTPERCKMIHDAGYFASVWDLSHSHAAEFRKFIDMGVTEFTDDYNCSYGLNW